MRSREDRQPGDPNVAEAQARRDDRPKTKAVAARSVGARVRSCPEGVVSFPAVGVAVTAALPKEQARGLAARSGRLRQRPRVCWTADSSKQDHILRRHGPYRGSLQRRPTGLSLGEAERSSHRCRHTRCSNSSHPAATRTSTPVTAPPRDQQRGALASLHGPRWQQAPHRLPQPRHSGTPRGRSRRSDEPTMGSASRLAIMCRWL
jgi:hypothetical protein